jgi:hypothetical protein
MKPKTVCASVLAAIALVAGSTSLQAQPTNLLLYNFDTDQVSATPYGAAWGNWFGGVYQGVGWDSLSDSSNSVSSGSMQLSLLFTGGDQYVLNDGFFPTYTPLDLLTWTNLSFDIRYDTSSAIRTNTVGAGINGSQGVGSLDFGYMRIGSKGNGGDFGQYWYYYFAIPATNGAGLSNTNWQRVSINLAGVAQTFGALNGGLSDILVGMDAGAYGNNVVVGPQTVWFDNIQLSGNIPSPPPPTLAIEKATPALRLFGGSGQFGRAQLQVVGTSESWVGGTFPVSYSFTALDNATSPGGLDYHIHLITGTDGYSGADYTQPNVLWLQIISGSGANTACIANISWKTNAPAVNPNQTASGAIALTITNPVLAGTWTLTFNSITNGTLTAPGAAPAPFTIALSESDVLTYFSNPLEARFGIQNFGNTANGGVPHDFAHISVSGTFGIQINQDFTQEGTNQLDPAVWDLGHSDGAGVVNLVPTNAPYWVKWTTPDTGFALNSRASLTGGASNWNTVLNVTPTTQSGIRWALIPSWSLPAGSENYFAMVNRTFSQLQVLLPGETNAPNTLTGKVGTPDPVSLGAGGVINVTINAVDSTYHIVTTAPGNTITLSCTDLSALLPGPAPLVNGTVTQQLIFGSSGSFTITASNTSNISIPDATSSSVTVNP